MTTTGDLPMEQNPIQAGEQWHEHSQLLAEEEVKPPDIQKIKYQITYRAPRNNVAKCFISSSYQRMTASRNLSCDKFYFVSY